MNEIQTLAHAAVFPYDMPEEDLAPARPAVDWAHAAARGVIKRGFDEIDEETRVKIVDTLAAIIRAAPAWYAEQPADARAE